MIVTIDGPAGAGKSTVARRLAERLGFDFLDTGAMYRCVTLVALERGVDLTEAAAVAEIAEHISLRFEGSNAWIDGRDVSAAIRDPLVSASIKTIADNPKVRRHLISLQRSWGVGRNFVSEGRDQGTDAFPEADCKFFLTASPEERARRRLQELRQTGKSLELDDILDQQNRRDHADRTRPVGALKKAADAIEISTDGLDLSEVVDQLELEVRKVVSVANQKSA